MREKKPESRFLSCLLVSVTLVHKSSQNFRSGRKLGTFKMRKQKARAENGYKTPKLSRGRLPAFLLGGVKGTWKSTGFEIRPSACSNAGSVLTDNSVSS